MLTDQDITKMPNGAKLYNAASANIFHLRLKAQDIIQKKMFDSVGN